MQIRRLQHAVIITSLPIAIYGIVQHYGIDPLPWGGDVSTRVAANAGNAIFLAAYLIMAFFLTLERVYSSFAYLLWQQPRRVRNRQQDMPTALAGGAYLFVLMVQVLAIFWTQSRGPWLGLLAGALSLCALARSVRCVPRFHRGALLGGSVWVLPALLYLVLMNTTARLCSADDRCLT